MAVIRARNPRTQFRGKGCEHGNKPSVSTELEEYFEYKGEY
jgi:hypothetical protein